jgi:hypothetical protein
LQGNLFSMMDLDVAVHSQKNRVKFSPSLYLKWVSLQNATRMIIKITNIGSDYVPTLSGWPFEVLIVAYSSAVLSSSNIAVFQSLAVLSDDPDAMNLPSFE